MLMLMLIIITHSDVAAWIISQVFGSEEHTETTFSRQSQNHELGGRIDLLQNTAPGRVPTSPFSHQLRRCMRIQITVKWRLP